MEASAKKRHRSPSYPAIDLETAIERAQRLWDAAGKHPAPIQSAMKAWGYSERSSGGLQTAAALKQYGLAVDRGTGWSREITLTQAAQELLVYGADRDSEEWKSRVRRAALQPKMFRELWMQYEGSLPDDSMMLPHLRLKRGFSDAAARDMLKRFRATIAFTGLTEKDATVMQNGGDSENSDDADGGSNGGDSIMSPETIEQQHHAGAPTHDPEKPKPQGPRTIQVTYSPTEWALVQGSFPMSETDWQSFLAVLQSMKPGLVVSDE